MLAESEARLLAEAEVKRIRHEMRGLSTALAGDAPILVDRRNGSILPTGTGSSSGSGFLANAVTELPGEAAICQPPRLIERSFLPRCPRETHHRIDNLCGLS
ncbi:hypothetical protein ACIBG8_09220 [Nonomuraea sp. NPDC050556]|uniref:hypothetical protein n=1 Tax=Nonomuraea sp. NPDC050556 TaxID=3364369 RepID=UPI0037894ACE